MNDQEYAYGDLESCRTESCEELQRLMASGASPVEWMTFDECVEFLESQVA